MENQKTNYRLKDYLEGRVELTPDLPVKGLFTSKWGLKLRLTTSRLYWHKRKPTEYLKVLCACLDKQFSREDLVIRTGDKIIAQEKCQLISANIVKFCSDYNAKRDITRVMGGFLAEYTGVQWCGCKNMTEVVSGHIRFIWSVTSAIEQITNTDIAYDEDALQLLKKDVTKWTAYLESIASIAFRE